MACVCFTCHAPFSVLAGYLYDPACSIRLVLCMKEKDSLRKSSKCPYPHFFPELAGRKHRGFLLLYTYIGKQPSDWAGSSHQGHHICSLLHTRHWASPFSSASIRLHGSSGRLACRTSIVCLGPQISSRAATLRSHIHNLLFGHTNKRRPDLDAFYLIGVITSFTLIVLRRTAEAMALAES